MRRKALAEPEATKNSIPRVRPNIPRAERRGSAPESEMDARFRSVSITIPWVTMC
jgi:hypothetical protein